MSLRPADLSDLNEALEVVLSGMPHDPQWDYRFPYRHEYPEDHSRYTKILLECFLDPTWDDWQVMVIEVPSEVDNGSMKIASISIWNVSYQNFRKYGPDYRPQNARKKVMDSGGATRKDANFEHMAAFVSSYDEAMLKRFGSPSGGDQLHLQILATHLDHSRHGYATKLVKWGLSYGATNNLMVNLMASPMGCPLYRHLNFESCGIVTVQVESEEEQVKMNAMKYETTYATGTESKMKALKQ